MSYAYPSNSSKEGGVELSSKKKLACPQAKERKRKSSIVSRLQIPKGDP